MTYPTRRFSISKKLIITLAALSVFQGSYCEPVRSAEQTKKTENLSSSATETELQKYVTRVQLEIRKGWHPRPSMPHKIKVGWKIDKTGKITDVTVLTPVDAESRSEIIRQIQACSPLPPPPPGERDEVHFEFTLKTEYPPPLGLTVHQAIEKFGPAARKVLKEECERANVAYPPTALALIALKKEKCLLLFANLRKPVLIQTFPLVSFSGTLGPKLKEGDLQIPEGTYRITNLAASFRLALGVDYPNQIDRLNALSDHRTKLGGSILVHGGSVSTGCLVVSNEDMKQIFTAVYDVGCSRTKLIIAPCNLLTEKPDLDMKTQPKWLPALYKDIAGKLKDYAISSGKVNL